MRVVTVRGAGSLAERDRTEVETAVGDVLSQYVVGRVPRGVPARGVRGCLRVVHRAGRRGSAAGDIELLTAADVQDAESVRATRLDARLSFLVDDHDVVGATAAVRFGFEAAMGDGENRRLSLVGRFMLVQEDGTWSIFGYDVAHDDAAALGAEGSS